MLTEFTGIKNKAKAKSQNTNALTLKEQEAVSSKDTEE